MTKLADGKARVKEWPIFHTTGQGTKIFQYCTCPAGLVTHNFHLSLQTHALVL